MAKSAPRIRKARGKHLEKSKWTGDKGWEVVYPDGSVSWYPSKVQAWNAKVAYHNMVLEGKSNPNPKLDKLQAEKKWLKDHPAPDPDDYDDWDEYEAAAARWDEARYKADMKREEDYVSNPSRAFPRGKWIKASVRVTKSGKIEAKVPRSVVMNPLFREHGVTPRKLKQAGDEEFQVWWTERKWSRGKGRDLVRKKTFKTREAAEKFARIKPDASVSHVVY